jgi:hypothetical protein
MADLDWNYQLTEQLDRHWREHVRPRLAGLTDAEYRWEPVAGAWNVRPRGTGSAPVQAGAGEFVIDYAWPEPDPAPVTTIAWRLGHITVGAGVHGRAGAAHQPGDAAPRDRDRAAARPVPVALRWRGGTVAAVSLPDT